MLQVTGWLLARLPESGLRALSATLGTVLYAAAPRRRRLIRSNLHHAFRDRPPAWHRRIARASCRRLVETALLSLAMPFLSERRLRGMLRASPALLAAMAARTPPAGAAGPGASRPAVFASPHLCHWECQTAMPLLVPTPFPEFGVIFRPLDQPAADAWLKRTRGRFGMRLLSRKAGFQEAMTILRRGGCIGLLFDQNAGLQGALSLLFDRIASSSELPGLLAERFAADVFALIPRRRGFWRVELDAHPLAHDGTSAGVTLALNRWLEGHLRSDDEACASWLWLHDRWRHQDIPARRLRLEAKRSLLDAELRQRTPPVLPRNTRIWIRLPNWLGDLVLALPLLRALRASRPDAELTLLAAPHFRSLLESLDVADRVLPLPARGWGYWPHFFRLRREYPDCSLIFTHSVRGDLEAWTTRCRQRFGLVRPGRPRPLLTHRWRVPPDFEAGRPHQLELWTEFLRQFGLNAPPDLAPMRLPATAGERPGPAPIGIIGGSENEPAKRWPVGHWRTLIAGLAATRPGVPFLLFGTANDRPVADAVARDLGAPVENLAGRTDLVAFARRLTECRLLVTNDTGGMHLANALGVPVVALFGPTNPRRTGPAFRAPVRILQPPGCPPTGGASLADLAPATVLAAVNEMLA